MRGEYRTQDGSAPVTPLSQMEARPGCLIGPLSINAFAVF